MRTVPFVNFQAQYEREKERISEVVHEVFSEGHFVGGRQITELEQAVARLCKTDYAVAVNSGTDALLLAMLSAGVGRGDEVITPPNSFVASTAAIVHIGATPVFVDVLDDQNIAPQAIAQAITPKTKAIMPVHLTGRVARMREIMGIARAHGLLVIEDAAQAFGSRLDEQPAGSFGDLACFSAHPLKNLNAAGDAGLVITNYSELADRIRRLSNHGMLDRDTVAEFGLVSRMDTLQAAVLCMRLAGLDDVVERRRRNARIYQENLDPRKVFFQPCREDEFNTFHTFIIQADRRDELQEHLRNLGIGSAIHYPRPIHLQPAAVDLGYGRGDFPVVERQAEQILSLPVHQFLEDDDIHTVADAVNRFYDA